MLDERIANLIQADVDGELDAADRPELDAALERSDEARRFREEMLRVARLMSGLPPVDTPPELTGRILERIELPQAAGWLDWSRGLLRPASYALAVAAGMVIAVGIVNLAPGLVPQTLSGGQNDVEHMVGTMVIRGDRLTAQAGGRMSITAAGVEGQIGLRTYPGTWAVEFELDSPDAVELRLDLTGTAMRFGGFSDPGGEVRIMDLRSGVIRVVNQGKHRFVVFLRPEPGSASELQHVAVAVSRGGEVLLSGRLQPGG